MGWVKTKHLYTYTKPLNELRHLQNFHFGQIKAAKDPQNPSHDDHGLAGKEAGADSQSMPIPSKIVSRLAKAQQLTIQQATKKSERHYRKQ